MQHRWIENLYQTNIQLNTLKREKMTFQLLSQQMGNFVDGNAASGSQYNFILPFLLNTTIIFLMFASYFCFINQFEKCGTFIFRFII